MAKKMRKCRTEGDYIICEDEKKDSGKENCKELVNEEGKKIKVCTKDGEPVSAEITTDVFKQKK